MREPWLQAVDLLGDWTSVLVGGLPKAGVGDRPARRLRVLGLARAAQPASRRVGRSLRARRLAMLQLTMVAMMVERHPPVAWPGSRLWYYPLPYQALVTFGALWALEALARGRADSRSRGVPLALAGLVVLNVLAWPALRATMNADPPFEEQNTNSAAFVRSFRRGLADLQLGGSNRIFYFECLSRVPPSRRARPDPGRRGRGLLSLGAARRAPRRLGQKRRAPRCVDAPGGALRARGERMAALGRDALGLRHAGRRPELVGEIRRSASQDGLERFRIVIELGNGANAIQILSALPETDVPGAPRRTRAAYRLALPVLVLPAPAEQPSVVPGTPPL